MSRWWPALRMARRDLWRHKGRTLLTMLLVALPVLVGVAAAQLHHNAKWEGERAARAAMGGADALVEVTPYERVRVRYWPGDMVVRPASFTAEDGKRRPVKREARSVDVAALLPAGSRIIAAPAYGDVALASGGVGHVVLLDAADPMAEGIASIASGQVPSASDEVALSEVAAEELGLLDADGDPLPGAEVALFDGTRLRVVGVVATNSDAGYGGSEVGLLASPDSVLADRARSYDGRRGSSRYLVDLPASAGEAPQELARALTRDGVGLLSRDVMFHPEDWDVEGPAPGPVDPASLAIGALVVLFGLVEVVLIVGSVFAVGARRQVRDLGLVAASGGAPADVRRVLLAQGLVLGLAASVVGCLAGLAAFTAAAPTFAEVTGQQIWSRDVDWLSVVGVTALGSLTALVAAFVPARSIGRLTPVAALSGRFPIRPGESRAHRPAFVLAAVGLALLGFGGWWSSVEYAPVAQRGREAFGSPSTVPVVVGAIGLLMLIGGVVWSAPYVVRRLAALGRLLPLSGRFAFRDAARHRFRTAAAAITLTVTVAGAVFAGFTVQAVAADLGRNGEAGEHVVTVYLDEGSPTGESATERTDVVVRTVQEVLGPAETFTSYRVSRDDRRYSELAVHGRRGDYTPVRVVDEDTLAGLVVDDAAALEAFRAGSVVTTAAGAVKDGEITVALSARKRHPEDRWTLPAAVVEGAGTAGGREDLFVTWISEETVRGLGLVPVPSVVSARLDRPVTSDDLTRLAVHGIDGWSPDTELETVRLVRVAVGGAAGLLTLLVVGMTVALSSAEGRADQATMAAVGAGPWRRRSLGAMHGLFLGLVGLVLGAVVGLPAGAALMQVDGAPGVVVPWTGLGALLVGVPLLGWVAGWLVTSTRLTMVRRTA